MESMEEIVSSRSLRGEQIHFKESKSTSMENGHKARHDVTRVEFVVFSGGGKTSTLSHTMSTFGTKHMEIDELSSETEVNVYSNLNSDPLVISNTCNNEVINRPPDISSPRARQTTVKDELHIAHRTCKKRVCDFCRPKADNLHHKGSEPVDSALFFRWEKVCDERSTPSVFLRKVKYAINGAGQVSKVVDRKKSGRVRASSEAIKSKIRLKLDTLRGHRVIARWDQDGLYYPAVVVKCPDSRHAVVNYDSGSNADVLTRNIILTGGAVARPKLQVGDYVMMRVVNLDTNDECYVPAIIQNGPQKMEAQAKFYSVIMYNGQKASTLRTFLVKISKERFELASMYICLQQHEDREEADAIVHVTPRVAEEKKTKAGRNVPKRPADNKKPSRNSRWIEPDTTKEGSARSFSPIVESPKDYSPVEEGPRSYSPRDYSWREDSPRENSPREISSRGVSSRHSSPNRSSNREQSISIIEENLDHSVIDSSRSVGSAVGRTRELDRLLKEIKEKEDRQERQMRKLKRKAKKLAKWEQKLEAKRYASDEQWEVVNAIKTPSPDMSADEEEILNRDEKIRSPGLLHLRKSLQRLRPGEEVLARWSDDGWYYRGIVKHDHEDYSYNLEDSTGVLERIWREDIISENDCSDPNFQPDSKVIALHPDYDFSYAPGIVKSVDPEGPIEVEFYDEKCAVLRRNEVYLSVCETRNTLIDKHSMDVRYILKQESRWIGTAVIARDDSSGAFYPGSITRRAANNADYVVSWSDGTEVEQNRIYIFTAFTRRPPLCQGDRVLALADPLQVKFLPGTLMGSSEDNLVVKFCDGEISEAVDPASCYWLGKAYFDEVVAYYKARDPSFY